MSEAMEKWEAERRIDEAKKRDAAEERLAAAREFAFNDLIQTLRKLSQPSD